MRTLARWLLFLALALVVTLAVALGAGALLHLALGAGLYLVILAPTVLAIVVAAVVFAAVALAQCRSRVVGMLVGLTAGVVLYLGQFWVGLVATGGSRVLTRLDLLEQYIAASQRTQLVSDSATTPHTVDRFDVVENWVFFAFELGVVVAITTTAGYGGATVLFCETCRRRPARRLALLPALNGAAIVSALETGELERFAAVAPVVLPPGGKTSYTAVALQACTAPGCPAHVSVKEIRSGGGQVDLQRFELAAGETLVRRRAVSPEARAKIESWRAFGGRGAPTG